MRGGNPWTSSCNNLLHKISHSQVLAHQLGGWTAAREEGHRDASLAHVTFVNIMEGCSYTTFSHPVYVYIYIYIYVYIYIYILLYIYIFMYI